MRRARVRPLDLGGGSTEQLLRRFGQRHAAFARGGVGIAGAAIAPWGDAPIGTAGSVAVSIGLSIWTVVYVLLLVHAPRVSWPIADAAVVGALCLAIPLLDSPWMVADHTGWVIALCAVTIVSSHWHVPPPLACVITIGLAGAYFVGGSIAVGASEVAFASVWLALGGGLSALAWWLVRRGGRLADVRIAEQLSAQREADLAAARRADQRAHWATLHDSAATTLLMIGEGDVPDDARWLRAQLDRDIAALVGARPSAPETDLVAALAARLADRPDVVRFDRCDPPVVPAAVVEAMVGAVSEAVENARRHSGGAAAHVGMKRLAGDGVVVTVRDGGRGFDPAAVPGGHGLRWSILARMRAVGGRAEVDSAPGAGTCVRLEWPGG